MIHVELRRVLILAGACAFALPATAQDVADPVGAVGLPAFEGGTPPCEREQLCDLGGIITNGEAFAGNGLIWQTDFTNTVLRLVDTQNGCAVLKTCPVPFGAPSENAYDGHFVYHYNFETGLIYQIDPDTCAIVNSCNAPGDDLAEGLTFDGEFLWKGDSTTLYKFSWPCNIVATCPNPAGESADGLAMCGNFLIMLSYSGILYQIDPTTCEVVSACALNQGAIGNGITADGVSSLFSDRDTFIDLVKVDCGVSFDAPFFSAPSPCGQILSVTAGSLITYEVTAQDLDTGDDVTLDATGVPAGATHVPGLPTTGNPVLTTFSWTTTGSDVGVHEITYTAVDLQGNSTECTVTLDVTSPFQSLDNGCIGTNGFPHLSAEGTLAPASALQVDLVGALAHAYSVVMVGSQAATLSREGCSLLFLPEALVPETTDANGSFMVVAHWPAGLSPGLTVFLQCYVIDGGAPTGFSSSNTIQITTP